MIRHFAAPDGRRLAYRDEGPASGPASGAPTVLCLAGLTRDARDFEPLAARLAGRYRVVRLDARGRGGSDWAKEPIAEYQVPVEAGDALALLDHLGIARTALIGTSRGGLIGLGIGTAAPGRLSCLVLNDVGPVVEPSGLERIMGYVGIDPGWADFSEAATGLALSMGASFPDLTGEQWMAFARSIYADDEGRPRLSYDPRIREAVAASIAKAPPDLWTLFDRLGELPVLAIRGERSDVLSAETLAEMVRRRPATRTVTVPQRGHAPFLDEPEAVAAIEAFLDAHAG